MNRFVSEVELFIKDKRGATAIEYGLIAALISVVVIASITSVGKSLKSIFDTVNSNLQKQS